MSIRVAVILITCIWATASHAGFYKCTIDGKTTFSDKPCGKSAEVIEVKPAGRINGSDYKGDTSDYGMSDKMLSSLENSRKRRELERKIKSAKVELSRAKRNNTKEMARLRLKKERAANNVAGATWEDSISNEMIAMSKQYEVEVQRLNYEIARLQDQLDSLEE